MRGRSQRQTGTKTIDRSAGETARWHSLADMIRIQASEPLMTVSTSSSSTSLRPKTRSPIPCFLQQDRRIMSVLVG